MTSLRSKALRFRFFSLDSQARRTDENSTRNIETDILETGYGLGGGDGARCDFGLGVGLGVGDWVWGL